jgi:hypothetical protein
MFLVFKSEKASKIELRQTSLGATFYQLSYCINRMQKIQNNLSDTQVFI